jgi:hypothetical protein
MLLGRVFSILNVTCWQIVVKNSIWPHENHRLKNTDPLEWPTIGERLSRDGLMLPKSCLEGCQKSFLLE